MLEMLIVVAAVLAGWTLGLIASRVRRGLP